MRVYDVEGWRICLHVRSAAVLVFPELTVVESEQGYLLETAKQIINQL
jgi:hypothetical protein